MLIIQVNMVGAQPLEGGIYRCTDNFRAESGTSGLLTAVLVMSKWMPNLVARTNFISVGFQGSTHQFLVVVGIIRCAVELRRVSKNV